MLSSQTITLLLAGTAVAQLHNATECSGHKMDVPRNGTNDALLNKVRRSCAIKFAGFRNSKRIWSSDDSSMQIYWCNYNLDYEEKCSVGAYLEADEMITKRCGADGGGWVEYKWYNETGGLQRISVGRDPKGTPECADWGVTG